MKLLKTLAILLVIVTVFGGAAFALNFYTGPIIEANKLGAIKDKLNLAMPGAESYEELELKDLPASVSAVYKETSGKGFVVICTAKSDYTAGDPMEIVVAVDTAGKISGISLVSHSESLIFGADYPSTYVGADSTLFGVELYAGSTYSSKAFKGAVEEAMNALIANNLIKAGEKSPEQILTELIATVAPELANAKKSEGKGDIVAVYKASGSAAYIVKDGDAFYLAVIAADGACKLYDVEGADVTASKADVVKKATDYAASAANERLNEVLAGAAGFEDITATLANLPASVVKVHKETSGLGFAIEIAAVGYNKEAPMDVVLGVDAEGKIVEIKIFGYNDTPSFDMREKDPTYLDSYKGKDSALEGVGTVSGATVSSTGFKTAIAEAMETLVANNLISAGVKSDAQILEELIPTVAPGFTKLENETATGNIQKAFKAANGTGFAYIVKSGDASYLAVVNAMGVCAVYDVEGNDVTSANAAIADEAVAHAAAKQTKYTTALTTKLERMMTGATDITPVAIDTFNTVVSAVSFKFEDATYYAFYSRSIGFEQMDVYFVIDENGAIVKMDAKQLIFEEEYFFDFGGMPENYKGGFEGVTGETWSDDIAVIATATRTSNAMKQSTKDAFAAFNSIKGGEQ